MMTDEQYAEWQYELYRDEQQEQYDEEAGYVSFDLDEEEEDVE